MNIRYCVAIRADQFHRNGLTANLFHIISELAMKRVMYFEENTTSHFGIQNSGFYQFVNEYEDIVGKISYVLEGNTYMIFAKTIQLNSQNLFQN